MCACVCVYACAHVYIQFRNEKNENTCYTQYSLFVKHTKKYSFKIRKWSWNLQAIGNTFHNNKTILCHAWLPNWHIMGFSIMQSSKTFTSRNTCFFLYSGYSLSQTTIFSFSFFNFKGLRTFKAQVCEHLLRTEEVWEGEFSQCTWRKPEAHCPHGTKHSLHKEHTNTKTNCRQIGDWVSKSRCFWTSRSSHMLNIHWRLHDSTTCTQVVLRNYNPLKMFFDLWFCVNFQTCVVFKRYIYNKNKTEKNKP